MIKTDAGQGDAAPHRPFVAGDCAIHQDRLFLLSTILWFPQFGCGFVMPDANLSDIFVILCDWRGRCVWVSAGDVPVTIGDPIWQKLDKESQEKAKNLLSQVVALRETREIQVTDQQKHRYRAWMWPLDSPDMAICILSAWVPRRLGSLTAREMDCLQLLAQGLDTRAIADRMDVSQSTIHTFTRRAREKLKLPNMEALIGFAARYCYPLNKSLQPDSMAAGT